MKWMVILDIETSGLDPEKNGLVSIGAVDFRKPRETFYGECKLRRGEVVNADAAELLGVTAKDLRDPARQTTKELLNDFALWLSSRADKVVGGLHVNAFDVPFLNKKAEQTSVSLRLHRRSIDLHSIAYAKILQLGKIVPLTDGWSVMDVDFVYPLCGMPREPLPRHALNGAKWEAECMARLIYGKKLFKTFEHFPIPSYLI